MSRSWSALALVALGLALPGSAAAEPIAHAAATCSDYSNQADAQRAKDTRDADGDGIYCEALPCPCLKPGDESSPRRPTRRRKRKPKPKPRAQVINARITEVVDGDTIKVRAYRAKRSSYTVRLIGIDTPESRKPGTPIECGAKEAASNMWALGFPTPADTDGDGLFDDADSRTGRRVTLTTDPTQDTFDRYRRLLAYVTLASDGRSLNVEQVAAGWADVYVYRDKAFKQLRRFEAAQDRAVATDRGVWGLCAGDFHRPAA